MHVLFFNEITLSSHSGLRVILEKPVFDANLCDRCWTSQYYQETQRIFFSLPPTPTISGVTFSQIKKQRKLTQHEKFRKSSILTTELATVMSEASQVRFTRRVNLVQDLIHRWKSGDEVGLVEVDDGVLLFVALCIHIYMYYCSLENFQQ